MAKRRGRSLSKTKKIFLFQEGQPWSSLVRVVRIVAILAIVG